MRYLVTGGSGGLGQAVCAELLHRGGDVIVFGPRRAPLALGEHDALHWVQSDVRDGHHLPRVVKEQRVDVIVAA